MVVYSQKEIDSIEFELRNDKAAIVSTDTVMGIISLDKKNIYKIKRRPHYKKLVKFIKNFEQLNIFTPKETEILNKYWPGKLTVVKDKIAYRVPNNKFLLNLLDRFDFLYSSSANISGKKPIIDLEEAHDVFRRWEGKLVLVDNKTKTSDNSIPSTIINLDTKKVLREGNLNGEKILKEIYNE